MPHSNPSAPAHAPHSCPLCGSTITELPLTILVERNMVVAGGRFVVLTTSEMQVLERLAQAFPRPVGREQLFDWLYQLRPNEVPEIKILDVLICKIRKKVEPLGLRIDTLWGRGYGLAALGARLAKVA